MARVFPVVGWPRQIVPTHWNTGERGASDLFAPFGNPVVSMTSGRVVYTGNDPIGGINVVIKGDDGLTYYFAHMDDRTASTADVTIGQSVQPGTRVGGVGDSGNARGKGAHCHTGIGYGMQPGTGPQGGCGIDFDAVGLLQQVLDLGASTQPASDYRVCNTVGAGLHLRDRPRTDGTVVKELSDGAVVHVLDRAWRPVKDPTDGVQGWAAEQFLTLVNGSRCRVFNTDGAGLSIRTDPTHDATVLKTAVEGADLVPVDQAWRRIEDPADSSQGWAADQYLAPV